MVSFLVSYFLRHIAVFISIVSSVATNSFVYLISDGLLNAYGLICLTVFVFLFTGFSSNLGWSLNRYVHLTKYYSVRSGRR